MHNLLLLLLASCVLTFDSQRETCRTSVATNIEEPTVWGERCVNVVVQQPLEVADQLEILEGTTVTFQFGTGLQVAPGGSLTAIGTSLLPIRLVGSDGAEPGSWTGVRIDSDSTQNRLVHVDIANAAGPVGADFTAAVVIGAAAGAQLEHVAFLGGPGDGLVVEPGATVAFAANRFVAMTGVPVRIPMDQLHRLDAASTYDDVGQPWIDVVQGTVSSPVQWEDLGVPYVFQRGLNYALTDDDAQVLVEPGVKLLFEEGAAFDVEKGNLLAIGTAARPIEFRGTEDGPGHWAGLYVRSEHDNVLEEVVFADAGDAGWDFGHRGIIVTGNESTPGRLIIRNSQLENNAGPAIEVLEGGTLIEADNTFLGNEAEIVLR